MNQILPMTPRAGGWNTVVVPANGEWHELTGVLRGISAVEVLAKVSGNPGEGRYAQVHAFALNCFNPPGWAWNPVGFNFLRRKSRISVRHAYYRARRDRLQLRWRAVTGERHAYVLEVRTRRDYHAKSQGEERQILCRVADLWPDELKLQDGSGCFPRMIAVDETEATAVRVINQIGELDPLRPFQPFGPLPTLDSYVVLYSREAAALALRSASVHIEWDELPDSKGGWRHYYDSYGVSRDDGFFVDISILLERRWVPVGRVPLFQQWTDSHRVCRYSYISLKAPEFLRALPVPPSESSPAEVHSLDGALRLSLSGWDFGHSEYPSVLARTLTANAGVKVPTPLPNPPYTPTVRHLSMRYVAETTHV